MELRTERLYFSTFDPSYTELLFEMDNDPAVMEFIDGGDKSVPREGFDRIVVDMCERLAGWEPLSVWPVHEIDGDGFIGWMALKRDNQFPGEIEVGYRLRSSKWGRGFATEGARALLGHGFDGLGLEKIISHTLLVNVRSQRVMEKIGLSKECDFVYRQEALPDWDEDRRRGVKYSITKERWRSFAAG